MSSVVSVPLRLILPQIDVFCYLLLHRQQTHGNMESIKFIKN